MHIVARENLLATLTGPMYDPEQERQEEMAAFVNAILADLPASNTHVVITDSECGEDPEVNYPEYSQIVTRELIPLTYAANGDYYGLTAKAKDWMGPDDDRRLYNCYLGGCSATSAPGFVVSGARF